ncbi:hypothetical protein TcWFU_006324 [Taenia crassiceps]|uniref:Uncharacterized protein n=1 Tax=Taenia crassiceps TaxID=6207 RepID=A0ABR4QRK9_9CEST
MSLNLRLYGLAHLQPTDTLDFLAQNDSRQSLERNRNRIVRCPTGLVRALATVFGTMLKGVTGGGLS